MMINAWEDKFIRIWDLDQKRWRVLNSSLIVSVEDYGSYVDIHTKQPSNLSPIIVTDTKFYEIWEQLK